MKLEAIAKQRKHLSLSKQVGYLIYHEHYVSEELLSSPSRKFMISYDKDHGDIRQDETHLLSWIT